ncbi:MAG: sensor histidine kinase [Oscillospiraceae bacterium]
MIETPRNDHTPEQPAHPDRLDRVPQARLLNEVLLHVSAQLRTALGGMHIAVSRLAPPERRDADAALDRDAALLNRNYYALLRLSNNLSNAPMLLDDAPLTRENTDIVTWLDGLCRQASPLFALRNVALTFQCSAARHGAAINRVCLEQAVWNLLSNALKFTPEGGTVTVSLRFERRQVLLAVTDTGCGINAEDMEMVFDGYLHPERLAALPSGLGLGLPLCRRIAEGHGGRLVLNSRVGHGTTVTLALPDELAEDVVEDVAFDYTGGFQPALVGLADGLPFEAFLQKHSDE